ncbi:MAG TPA: chloride channel protein [Chthoniobacteraceae bacterium]|jgi:CIC family chloride channel protein
MPRFSTAFRRLPDKTRSAIETVAVGLVASAAAVAFQLCISLLHRAIFQQWGGHSFEAFAVVSFVSICAAALISGWLLNRLCPEASGSGIPQLKLAYWKDFGYTPSRISGIKFIAGVCSIGGGLSLGREGPSVQIGGCLGSTVAGLFGAAKQKRRAAAAAGAAAGLAAAFNAPMAAVAFVLEEILEDLNSAFLGSALLAAVIGAFVVLVTIGPQPAFEVPLIGGPTWRAYLLMPLVSALAVLSGIAFQRGTLALRKGTRKSWRLPRTLQLLIGAVATWAIAILVYSRTANGGVFGLGYDDLTTALQGGIAWQIAAALLVGKLVATILCYGLGGCGGIFSPALFFGGMAGAFVGGLGSRVVALTPTDQVLLVVGGMSACLGAVVQAPLTALLIIFEMTHQFALVPGLMLAGLVSLVLTRWLHRPNFYEQVLEDDGHEMKRLIPPRDLRSWQGLPIATIGNFSPVVVQNLDPTELRKLLEAAPFSRFPVMCDGRIAGVVTRREIEAALREGRPPEASPTATALPQITVREAQILLIESATGLLVIAGKDGRVVGIVTLHDLLRVQSSLSEQAA